MHNFKVKKLKYGLRIEDFLFCHQFLTMLQPLLLLTYICTCMSYDIESGVFLFSSSFFEDCILSIVFQKIRLSGSYAYPVIYIVHNCIGNNSLKCKHIINTNRLK